MKKQIDFDMPYGIHWFRRDLRTTGNSALIWSQQKYQGRVLGVFFFDPEFLKRPDFSENRFGFFLRTLESLQKEMRTLRGDLLVMEKGPKNGFDSLFTQLKENRVSLPDTVSFNRDYEPFARSRDETITSLLQTTYGVKAHTERDHLLIEPRELWRDEKKEIPYKVYTPFAKKWFMQLHSSPVQARIVQSEQTPSSFSLTWEKMLKKNLPHDCLSDYLKKSERNINISLPKAGSAAAQKRLHEFKQKLENYAENRDYPALNGTSGFSIYLKNGSLTVAQVISALDLKKSTLKGNPQKTSFLKELVWREFFYAVLYHFPRVEKEAFQTKFKDIKWENREDYFRAWCEGRTGYPIVDAGMRQLNQTGWMHNRVRMIVASFLTKDLLIDWRLGENYFMKTLLDGDLAPNNGGWQWAASTGCDAQPFFRIFNPVLQSRKFDPNGDYIRKYVQELKHLSPRQIHEPVQPIVNHSAQKLKVLRLYS